MAVFKGSAAAGNRVQGDDNGRFDIFVKDMANGKVARVNIGADGLPDTGGNLGGMQRPDISDDGQYVVFDGSGDVFFALNPLLPRPDLTGLDLLAQRGRRRAGNRRPRPKTPACVRRR